jgi:hypothetical protein
MLLLRNLAASPNIEAKLISILYAQFLPSKFATFRQPEGYYRLMLNELYGHFLALMPASGHAAGEYCAPRQKRRKVNSDRHKQSSPDGWHSLYFSNTINGDETRPCPFHRPNNKTVNDPARVYCAFTDAEKP